MTKKVKGRKRRIGLRLGIWTISLFCVCATVLIFTLMAVMGTRLQVPEWVEERVMARLNQNTDAFVVSVESIAIVIEKGWVPRLQLRGIALSNASAAPFVRLAEAQTVLALKPMLQGQFKPRSVYVNGAQVVVRRHENGQIGLSVGGALPAVEEAPNLAAVIEQAHDVLENPHFNALREVILRNMTIGFEDARVNKVWAIDGAELSLERKGLDLQIRGDFALLGARDYATTLSVNYEGKIGSAAAQFGINLEDMASQDIAGQSPVMSWLNAIDAPISGAIRGEMNEKGALAGLNATLQLSEGVIQPNEAAQPVAFTAMRSYFSFDPVLDKLTFDELFVDSKWGTFTANGKALLVGMDTGWPNAILGQIDIQELNANPAGLYPEPVHLEGVHADLRLNLDPFVLTIGELSVLDQAMRINLTGEVAAKAEGWAVAIDTRLNQIRTDRLLELWPGAFKAKPRTWIKNNVIDASLENAQFSMRMAPGQKQEFYLGFEFHDMATRFVKGLPPIEGASGRASLAGRRFVITADQGQVTAPQGGRIDVSGTSFVIPNTDIRGGPAQVMLRTKSTITAGLALLDEKPFEFMKKAGRPVVLADGRAEVSGQIDILLKKRLLLEDVGFDLQGRLSNVTSEQLIPGKVLTAQALQVSAVPSRLEISGSGRIGQVPFEALWGADLGPGGKPGSKVEGWVELSGRFLDEFRIGLPPGSLTGVAQAPITLELPKGAPGSFLLTSDLAGLGLRLRELDWSLSEDGKGVLEVSGRLAEPVVVDKILLNAPGLEARGNVSLRPDGELDRASFTSVKAGSWLDAPVELVGQGKDQPPAVRVLGGVFDVRQASVLKGPQDGQAARSEGNKGPVSLVLDELIITDGITLTNFKADLTMTNGASGPFTGQVNQGGKVSGRIVPQKGGSAFIIRSEEAGRVMASAGLLKNARGGTMELRLVPAKTPGEFDGQLEAQNMRLTEAPTMAALLNAVSIVGLVEQMGGDGIHFRTVDGRFRLAPDRVTVYSGSAVGPSMGISLDGYYDTGRGQMDFQGVISPVYVLNVLGGAYSRKGEGLFGFNYTLTGTADDPDVYVNPLTALAPGLFRELFRRPAPKRDGTNKDQDGGAAVEQESPPPKTNTGRQNDR
ncbi:YhdP family protein [Roseovarius albus]|uniref:YhdP family protein n=1 Tax=Roseovarius albus TaxID=1247867 RepID=UPI00117A64D6|nr:DUF3971 domain-containing protein [Roseovarius albus]